jgi:hypothetical protein
MVGEAARLGWGGAVAHLEEVADCCCVHAPHIPPVDAQDFVLLGSRVMAREPPKYNQAVMRLIRTPTRTP